MKTKLVLLVTLFGSSFIAIVLYSWGQPLICTCGEINLWVNNIFSSQNSQQIADWYSLSHFSHGLLIALVWRVLFKQWPWKYAYAISVFTGIGWELVEHTDFVLERFRESTAAIGYYGDSVLNAVADYWFMTAGFLVASRIKIIHTLTIVLVFELVAGLYARDNLTLATIMIFTPVEAIKVWQEEITP